MREIFLSMFFSVLILTSFPAVLAQEQAETGTIAETAVEEPVAETPVEPLIEESPNEEESLVEETAPVQEIVSEQPFEVVPEEAIPESSEEEQFEEQSEPLETQTLGAVPQIKGEVREELPPECEGLSIEECGKMFKEQMEQNQNIPPECEGLSPKECEMRMRDLYGSQVQNLPPECAGLSSVEDCKNVMKERMERMRKEPDFIPAECRGLSPDKCEEIMDAKYDEEFKRRTGFDEDEFDKRGEGFPTTIPADIEEAGAGQEFINLVCAMTKLNIGKMKLVIDAVSGAFSELSSDPELSFLTIDLSGVNVLKADIDNRINAVCSSSPESYPAAANSLAQLIEGENGIEKSMKSIFKDQIKSKMEAKMQEFQAEMGMDGFGGPGITGGFVKVKDSVVINEGQMPPCTDFADPQCLSTLQEQYCQGLTAGECQEQISGMISGSQMPESFEGDEQMQGSFGPSAEQLAKIEEFQAKMESIGRKMSELPNLMMAKVEEALKAGDDESLKNAVSAAQFALIKKMFEYHISLAFERKQELAAEGLDVSLFDELEAWKEEKLSEAQVMSSEGFNESKMFEFEERTKREYESWKERIEENVAKQILVRFKTEYSANKERIDRGISIAKDKGLDTTVIETYLSQMDTLIKDLEKHEDDSDKEEIFRIMRDIKFKYGKVKQELDSLRSTLKASSSVGGV